MVKVIIQDYKIVEKEETRVLLRTLKECRAIYKGWEVLSIEIQEKLNNILDNEIDKKLEKCFKYYQKHYNIEIEDGYSKMKNIEITIANICETIKSYEYD